MKITLEKNNPEVRSSLTISETKSKVVVHLKDCQETICWRFFHTTKEQTVKSLFKAERAILALQEVQERLKSKL